MFPSAKRTFLLLLRTPLVPSTSATSTTAVELTTFGSASSSRTATTIRPNAARAISNMSIRSMGMEFRRGYASDHGKKELYSDEGGSTGAGIDDVAHTDAAFNKDANPETSSKQVEKETGKDATKQSPSNAEYSNPPDKQGEKGSETPMRSSQSGLDK